MKKFVLSVCAVSLAIAIPATSIAAPRDGRGGGGVARPSAPAMRAPAPVMRAAPAPQARAVAPGSGGFNFNHDISARPAPAVPQRPPSRPIVNAPRPANVNPGAPNGRRFTGPVVRNPRAPGGTWGWNRGVAWNPAPAYWGGGFWGPFALANLAGAVLFGMTADGQNQTYSSYEIQPDTPGAELLGDYQLQQTQCGPPNLVVIWGPDNSVVCAYPTDAVGPGNYQVDPSTFTLVPAQ